MVLIAQSSLKGFQRQTSKDFRCNEVKYNWRIKRKSKFSVDIFIKSLI